MPIIKRNVIFVALFIFIILSINIAGKNIYFTTNINITYSLIFILVKSAYNALDFTWNI